MVLGKFPVPGRLNFTSQHNCDVVHYVNFYIDFVASN